MFFWILQYQTDPSDEGLVSLILFAQTPGNGSSIFLRDECLSAPHFWARKRIVWLIYFAVRLKNDSKPSVVRGGVAEPLFLAS